MTLNINWQRDCCIVLKQWFSFINELINRSINPSLLNLKKKGSKFTDSNWHLRLSEWNKIRHRKLFGLTAVLCKTVTDYVCMELIAYWQMLYIKGFRCDWRNYREISVVIVLVTEIYSNSVFDLVSNTLK